MYLHIRYKNVCILSYPKWTPTGGTNNEIEENVPNYIVYAMIILSRHQNRMKLIFMKRANVPVGVHCLGRSFYRVIIAGRKSPLYGTERLVTSSHRDCIAFFGVCNNAYVQKRSDGDLVHLELVSSDRPTSRVLLCGCILI